MAQHLHFLPLELRLRQVHTHPLFTYLLLRLHQLILKVFQRLVVGRYGLRALQFVFEEAIFCLNLDYVLLFLPIPVYQISLLTIKFVLNFAQILFKIVRPLLCHSQLIYGHLTLVTCNILHKR